MLNSTNSKGEEVSFGTGAKGGCNFVFCYMSA